MLKLSTLRFKAFRILLMTAKGDPNQVLTAFNLLGLAIVFPYLWLYLSEVAIGFVKLFLGIVLLIFIARQWSTFALASGGSCVGLHHVLSCLYNGGA